MTPTPPREKTDPTWHDAHDLLLYDREDREDAREAVLSSRASFEHALGSLGARRPTWEPRR